MFCELVMVRCKVHEKQTGEYAGQRKADVQNRISIFLECGLLLRMQRCAVPRLTQATAEFCTICLVLSLSLLTAGLAAAT